LGKKIWNIPHKGFYIRFPVFLLIMSNIVDSLRRQQKIIVLGAALAVIALYVTPLDQIFAQTSTEQRINDRFALAHTQVDNAFDRGVARVQSSPLAGTPQGYSIVANLEDQRANLHQVLSEHNYRIVGSLPPGAP
jgi:hypothetical protein